MNNKAVLISIRPEWCSKILSGDKKIEVRKQKPNIEPPFKCYIYQTLPKYGDWNDMDGHIIAEFTCDHIETYEPLSSFNENRVCFSLKVLGCLTDAKQVWDYSGGKTLYGWHISGLKVYEKPKKLREFTPWCKFLMEDGECNWRKVQCDHQNTDYNPDGTKNIVDCAKRVSRAPQSWCYVEELKV